MKALKSVFITFTLVGFCFVNSSARTWLIKVDGTGDAANIQAGISRAASGDTVLLADGGEACACVTGGPDGHMESQSENNTRWVPIRGCGAVLADLQLS